MQIKNYLGDIIHEIPGETLVDANLLGANLSNATLLWANLRGANLLDANLLDANLRGADLSDANLSGANLSGADLSGADLRNANLSNADLSNATLICANLSGADLSGATFPQAAEIQKTTIRPMICERVCDNPDALNMESWHTCETVHCIAGWAVTLHPQGRLLEAIYGTSAAAALILQSCEGEVPDFYSDKDTAMRWLKNEIEQ